MSYTLVFEEKFEQARDAYIAQNHNTAFEIISPFAEKGIDKAQMFLGLLYADKKDFNNAEEWYIKSAKQGLATAQFLLSNIYSDKSIGKYNEKKSLDWLEKSSSQGYSNAQSNLANAYASGSLGLNKDWRKSVELYKLIAEKAPQSSGMIETCFSEALGNLGSIYTKGFGNVKVDYVEALKWWKKGAKLGYPKSQQGLAVMYKFGNGGLDVDLDMAYDLYEKAASQGSEHAKEMLERVYN